MLYNMYKGVGVWNVLRSDDPLTSKYMYYGGF